MHATLICLVAAAAVAATDVCPTSHDARLVIEQFAAEPDIVTPTGIAVDALGRVLVVESHTHFRPPDYAGPTADRIRAFEDCDGDGRADRATNFYEGGTATMNLAVYEDGSVFVATRNEVFRLHDRDHDGKADERTPIARLETAGNYPHNGLSGFAFDGLGNVYFGLGENLGADYRLIGAGGQVLAGGGEGGSIYRCRADGTGLARFATGFWNPFHVCCDAFDRLFAVDNDPDSRPPCRLLHIVPAGDYGYRFRNGRKGVHPFTAWNGELPGTLPMTAGTGEAPSGVLAYESDALPKEYWGSLLVTSWGDHRIDRFRLEPRGASFRAVGEPIITGGENFRPVGIALAKDGSLFVSDWVDKSYQLHGKGRVWHIRSRDAATPLRPREPQKAILSRHRPLRQWAARELAGSAGAASDEVAANVAFLTRTASGRDDPHVRADALIALVRAGQAAEVARRIATTDASAGMRALATRLAVVDVETLLRLAKSDDAAEVRAEALRRLAEPCARSLQIAALGDSDPFVRQAARSALARSTTLVERMKLAEDDSSVVRLAGLALLRESADPAARIALPKLLADDDPTVRFAAVQWVAEEGLSDFRPQIGAGLACGATTRNLFEAYLAALERLDGVKRGVKDEWSGEQYVLDLILNSDTTAAVRARALRALRPDHPGLTPEVLSTLLASSDLTIQLETVRTLRERPEPGAVDALECLARDENAPQILRTEAIVGLSADTPARRKLLLSLAAHEDEPLRHEALRSLRGAALDEHERGGLAPLIKRDSDPDLVARLLGTPFDPRRPERHDIPAWAALIMPTGDPAAGERVFFHPRGPACYRCHQVDGRGGAIGPDLTVAPRSLSRERWLESLLAPAKDVAPQYAFWNIVRSDGTTISGVLLAEEPDGTRRYGTADGQVVTIRASEIAETRPQAGSVMPDNTCDLLTVGELRDVTAYLHDAH